MTDTWQDVPPARTDVSPRAVDDWQDVPPPQPSPTGGEGTFGTQGISDRLSKGFQPAGLQSYVLRKLPDIAADTATFFHEGVEQTVGAFTGNGPSQFDDIRPEVEKQLISIGRTPEAAKQETEALMRSWRRQERMGGAIMGPLTALTAPLLGAYRSLISRPLEEVGGPPKEVTEMAGMVAGTVAGMPAMSKQMARVTVRPDGKVSAQVVGDLPADADFKTAAELLTTPEPPKLVVAQKLSFGRVKYGKPGDIHADLLGPTEEPPPESHMGWAIPGGRFMTKEEALAFTKKNEPGRTTSLPENATQLESQAYHDPAGERFERARKIASGQSVTEQNLRTLWDERGIHPAEALNDARSDAFLKHDLTQPGEVFHGSPRNFDAFDVSKTAEGIQLTKDAVRAGTYTTGEGGTLYQVKINAPTENFLDRTKTIGEQSEVVQKAVADIAGSFNTSISKDTTGTDFYFALSRALAGDDPHLSGIQKANDMLRERGVPGVFDGSGTFVVNDDRVLQITHKNGVPVEQTAGAAPHPDRPLGAALQAVDELRAANRDLPNEDRTILGELISAVRGAAAKRQLSVEDGVVQQGDRFKKAPLSETPPADRPEIAATAWLEADQDLARAQAALARIDEVKARHPELAGQIDRAVRAVEDTLDQRDAMRPKSLGAEATRDPPLVPLSEQPLPPPGALVASAQEGARTLFDIGRDIQMKVSPMVTGTRESILIAKDFADTMRKNRWEWDRTHSDITKRFTPESWKRMYDAADEESVLRQEGKASEHMGLATLEPRERALVDGLHARAENAWLRARDIGLVEGEGLPAYTPRMVINAAGAISEQGPMALNSMGTNLKASTARLMKRKYLTAEETEAAAKEKTRFAEAMKGKSVEEIEAAAAKVELVRDIRTLPLAIAQLEDAIAGRTLVNEIKKAGKAGGSETVAEGFDPSTPEQKWFTIDHPALKTWRPKFKEIDGKVQVVKDAQGETVFEQVPLHIRGDFEGPLRAVLETPSGATYRTLMDLKGKTMSVIMYSPAIHNLVELGRAFPAMPTRIFKAYFDGNRAKNDVAIMTEAIDSGLVPIGRRFFMQDLDSLMASPDLTPGRSWTAKLAAAVLTSERLLPQTDWMRAASEKDALAIKRGIDKMGDIWHNTLLWDRIGDLQMGLYVNLRGDLIGKGVDPKTSSIVAAHWANRYAGALPQEAMSAAARKTANMFLFSRSFTMGNLGVMKDMLTGLPKDVLAMIEREGGFKEGSINSASDIPQVGEFTRGMAMRKAMMIVALDIGLMYTVNSVAQSVFNVMLGDKTLDEETHGYTRRMKEVLNKIEMHPTELLHPFELVERLTPMSENEPGRKDRVRIGYQKDGTAIYARNPVGKIGEEFMGFMNNPLEMLRRKEGTVARPLLQIFANDKGFGRKVYDPHAETYMDKAAAIWAMVEHFGKAQTPEGSINALSDLIRGEGDPKTATLQTLGPFAGVTFSKGAPGGPAIGELYDFRSRHDVKVNMALPDIRKQILRGDLGGAMQRMRELDIPPTLQRFYIRTTLNPGTRASGRTLLEFYRAASPEQRERMERARQ